MTDSGVEITQPAQRSLDLITDGNGGSSFSLASINGTNINAVDGGTYMYYLKSRYEAGKGEIWYLSADKDEDTEPGDENPGRSTTPGTDAILSMASAPQLIFNNELNNLRFRKGALQSNDDVAGAWVRTIGNNSSISTGHTHYTIRQSGFELGVDKMAGDKTFFGGFTSYSNANIQHQRGGTSNIASYSVGLYATYFGQAGFYFDGVLKHNYFKNNLQARSTSGYGISGNYAQHATGGSVEVGYHTSIADNFWIEPYTRLSYVQVQGKKITLNNGMKASMDDQDSLNTEVGINVGKTVNVDQGNVITPYVKVAWAREYIDTNNTLINGLNRFDTDFSGNQGKVGAGINASLIKNTTLFAEVNYSKASKIETPVTGNLGLRYSF